MTPLQQIQQQFQGYLLARKPEVIDQIVSTSAASAEQRLQIYFSAYRLRLLDALQTDYPKLKQLLGGDAFETLGKRYIASHPSTHPSLRWFGRHMSEFLQRESPYTEQAWLPEMARFEWTQHAVFDAADAVAVSIEDVAALAPELWPNLRLRAHPSLHILNLNWNIPVMWRALEEEEDSQPQPERTQEPTSWLLWRKDRTIQWRSLDAPEACSVNAFCEGHNFGELCESLCTWVDTDEAPAQAASLLKRWINDALIIELVD